MPKWMIACASAAMLLTACVPYATKAPPKVDVPLSQSQLAVVAADQSPRLVERLAPQSVNPPKPPDGLPTISLNLSIAGATWMTPPSDIPPGDVAISLPLYPKAMPAGGKPGTPSLLPRSPYVKAGVVEYVAPVDRKGAEAWYRQKLGETGYKEFMSGSHETFGVLTSTSIGFEAPEDSNLRVLLDFEQAGSGRTLVRYGGMLIAVPARPAESLIASDVVKVEITYHPPDHQPTQTRTLTASTEIAGLVTRINALRRDTRGAHGGFLYAGQRAELAFVSQDGTMKLISVDPSNGSVVVERTVLLDDQGGVWKAVSALMSQPS